MKIFLIIVGLIFLSLLFINYIINYKKLKFDNMILSRQISEIRNNFKIHKSVSDCEIGELEILRSRYTELLTENMQLKSVIGAYRNAYENPGSYSSTETHKGTIEAVRYAMKKSHPDNGGSAEDFMRFKKCYEELTGKRG